MHTIAARHCPGPPQSTPDMLVFLQQWLRAPGQIGAIAPSSAHLARLMSAPVPTHGHPVVVELGAGTGAFSTEIQRRLAGRGRHLAIEVNAGFAHHLRSRFEGVEFEVVEADARRLPRLLAERQVSEVDVVVSSLPWASFGSETQRQLCDAILDVLSPHSEFTTFAYTHALPLPRARRFRDLLSERFGEVVISRTVWRNLPPAAVIHARRPLI